MPEISKIERRNIIYDIKDEVARGMLQQKYSKPATGIPMGDLAPDIRNILQQSSASFNNISHYISSFKESDPIFNASAAKGITATDITSWNNKTDNIGTITSVTMNGVILGTSGSIDLGSVITSHQDLSGKQDVLVNGTNIKSVNGQSVLGSGDIDTLDATVDEDTETLILF